jgi:hypothetical protein
LKNGFFLALCANKMTHISEKLKEEIVESFHFFHPFSKCKKKEIVCNNTLLSVNRSSGLKEKQSCITNAAVQGI